MSAALGVRRVDVVVCGGGVSGLAAAVEAASAGASVVVLEKAPYVGGSGRLSGGLLWTFSAERPRPPGDEALQELVIVSAEDTVAWMAELGVSGALVDMFHGPGRAVDPRQLVAHLLDRLVELSGEVRTSCPMTGLTSRPDGAYEVRASNVPGDPGRETLEAPAVVLATGGFQGNPEMLSRYGVDPDSVYLRANPWSTGDGLTAALSVGAAVTPGLDTFYGHAMAAPPARFTSASFREMSQYYGPLTVAVNMAGVRFADESAGTGEEALNLALSRQPQGLGFYVGDASTLRADASRGRGLLVQTVVDRAEAAGGVVVTARTLDDLAAGLAGHGVPRDTVLRTLRDYAELSRTGAWDSLSPPRTGHRTGLAEPPYFAVGVKAGITLTAGGIAVDEGLQVLDRRLSSSPLATLIDDVRDLRQAPVPGLFAAGCDAGNLARNGYLGGLLPALVTGRVAGRGAAGRAGVMSPTVRL